MTPGTRIGAIALLTAALTGAAPAPERGEITPPRVTSAQEVSVVAVVVDQRSGAPTVVLEGKRDKRSLAMVIGLAEATGIAVPLRGITPPRPLTHDLFLTLFARFNVVLTRVVITDLRDDIYYATVHLTAGASEFTLDARPSDAIALAIRAKVPVLVEDRVFDKSANVLSAPRPSI